VSDGAAEDYERKRAASNKVHAVQSLARGDCNRRLFISFGMQYYSVLCYVIMRVTETLLICILPITSALKN
jgi:hypothetical protein